MINVALIKIAASRNVFSMTTLNSPKLPPFTLPIQWFNKTNWKGGCLEERSNLKVFGECVTNLQFANRFGLSGRDHLMTWTSFFWNLFKFQSFNQQTGNDAFPSRGTSKHFWILKRGMITLVYGDIIYEKLFEIVFFLFH